MHTTLDSSTVTSHHVVKWFDPFDYDIAGYTALSYTVSNEYMFFCIVSRLCLLSYVVLIVVQSFLMKRC